MENKSLTAQLEESIKQVLTALGLPTNMSVHLDRPELAQHGDFATPIAMHLFKSVKANDSAQKDLASNPRELAQHIADNLVESNPTLIKGVQVAGPGFINISLTDAALVKQLQNVVNTGLEGLVFQPLRNKHITIEFTDPNPFKELHIGHLYSNVVGEAISRILEAQGAVVTRVCYQGDVGMHVAKSVWGMRELLKKDDEQLDKALAKIATKPVSERTQFLGRAYALGATAYEDNEEVKQEIKDINYLTFVAAQENLQAQTNWQPQVDYQKYVEDVNRESFEVIKSLYVAGRAWSLEYFDSMYQRIGMHFDDFFFESVVGEYGIQIVREFLTKGIFEESNGAIIFPGEKYGLHSRVFVNSLGLPTYEAKELGLAPEKYRRVPYDQSLIITGNEIDEYFKVLLKALEFTNPDLRAKTVHLSHGMVRLPEGKMSSRTGKVLTAEWLMDEAKTQIEKLLVTTRPNLSKADAKEISEVVGLSAIKFAFLKQSVGKDIAFSFEESLSFSGNSGPYLLYSLVRAKSVLAKASGANVFSQNRSIAEYFDTLINSKDHSNIAIEEDEKELLLNLFIYSDTVTNAAADFAPHELCTYLYKVAQQFNAFYAGKPIVSEKDESNTKWRVALTQAFAVILEHGLKTLGIKTVAQM